MLHSFDGRHQSVLTVVIISFISESCDFNVGRTLRSPDLNVKSTSQETNYGVHLGVFLPRLQKARLDITVPFHLFRLPRLTAAGRETLRLLTHL